MFLPFYLSVTFAGLETAILVPKLPPLSRKKDIYYNNANNSTEDLLPEGYTPLFQILGLPFIPILKLLQIPEAAAASSTLVAGFADMLLPSIMSGAIQSDMTRFIIAATSITQLIYLSEVGALLLGSKIPVNIKELFIIFLERTLITLPIISIIAHIIF